MPWQYPVHGIDVSKYQGDVDWHAVRRSGIDFAFIKATEGGDHTDDRFQDNWAAAAAAGMPRGAYHYYYFCRPAGRAGGVVHQPRAEGPLGAAAGARPRVDPQVPDLHPAPRPRDGPRRGPHLPRGADRLLRQAAGDLHDRRLLPRRRALAARGYHFWLRSVAGHPSDVYPGQRWHFWQYTGTGLVAGIEGPTDLNVFAGAAPSGRRGCRAVRADRRLIAWHMRCA